MESEVAAVGQQKKDLFLVALFYCCGQERDRAILAGTTIVPTGFAVRGPTAGMDNRYPACVSFPTVSIVRVSVSVCEAMGEAQQKNNGMLFYRFSEL